MAAVKRTKSSPGGPSAGVSTVLLIRSFLVHTYYSDDIQFSLMNWLLTLSYITIEEILKELEEELVIMATARESMSKLGRKMRTSEPKTFHSPRHSTVSAEAT